jgi:predicted dehydrogenase
MRPDVGVGVVGMGFMGTTHLLAGASLKGGRVVGIVTSDPRKARGDFSRVRGNFGQGGGRVDLRGVKVHPTIDALLADDAVDLVDVCLPSFLHSKAALRALRAGKHVLVEKPVALSAREARAMIETARKRRRLLMVAQVLKFFPEFSLISSALKDGRWGKLLAFHLQRAIAFPDWGARSWFGNASKSGGMVVDLHIHDTDFILFLFGKPRAVASSGLVRKGRVDFIRTVYHYGRGSPLLSSEAGWINSSGLPFKHGYDAYFEGGTLQFDSSRSPAPVLFDGKGPKELKLPRADGFREELQAAVDGVKEGSAPRSLSALSAALSLEVCRAEEKSAKTGNVVKL